MKCPPPVLRCSLTALAFAAAVLSSCDKKPVAAAGSPILAKAGDEVITVEDFQKEVARRMAKHVAVPDKTILLEEMAGRLAAVSRAKQAKLDADPETKRELESVLIAKLRSKELEVKIAGATVSDDELRKAYEAGAAANARPAKVRLAILHIQADGKMSDAKRTELRGRMDEALKKSAATPAEGGRGGAANGFGQVAAEYSDDQVSRYRGGDLGWLDEGNFSYRWPRAVLEAGYTLEMGKCSGIIETDTGLFAVMKTDRREGATTSFEEAKPSLRHDLLARKRAEIEAGFLSENRSLTSAETHPEALAGIVMPAPPAPSVDDAPPALPGGPAALATPDPISKSR